MFKYECEYEYEYEYKYEYEYEYESFIGTSANSYRYFAKIWLRRGSTYIPRESNTHTHTHTHTHII